MLLAILAPVLGMLGGPALLAVALVGPGIGGGGHFCAVPLGVSRPLAVRVRTETLRLRTGIWHKETLAMDTAHLAGPGFLLREAVSQYVALTGSRSTTTTADAEGNTG